MNAQRFGPLEPPDDYRIFNRRQPDGTFRPLADFFNPERKNMNNPLPKKISLETDLCDEIDALEAQSADLLAALKRFVEIHDTATNAQAAIKIIEEGWPPRGYRLQEETKP
jgi:hypothetical protein